MDRNSPIIVALDGMGQTEALRLVAMLAGKVWGFKVNDLLDLCGVQIVRELREYGRVMADPKLHDIPNTAANRARAYHRAGADFVTAHASGGIDMLTAVVGAMELTSVLAVTVLTSLGEEDAHLTYGQPSKAQVLEFARWAKLSLCMGIVCSSQELTILSEHKELEDLIRVVPGIRPAGAGKGDQKRVMTPKEAMAAGANFLVIGRPIYESGDPVENVKRIHDEIFG